MQKVKSGLKSRIPRFYHLYLKVLKAYSSLRLWHSSHGLSARLAFRRCIAQGRPYFGHVMAAQQGDPKRYQYMERIVELECVRKRESYIIPEIGSWASGSAIIWANAIKRFNDGRGMEICVDAWIQYIHQDDLEKGALYRVMKDALEKDAIIQLFLHNIRTSGHEDVVRLTRAKSDEILLRFKENEFDVLYVDGAHTYEQVLKDIQNAAPLVRDGGILCGDDLELQASDVKWESVKGDLRGDYVRCPERNIWFHPGVTLAVGRYFGEVAGCGGFWAMRKRGEGGV